MGDEFFRNKKQSLPRLSGRQETRSKSQETRSESQETRAEKRDARPLCQEMQWSVGSVGLILSAQHFENLQNWE
jgi:hypothetical protein